MNVDGDFPDDEFSLGDGDTEAAASCPCCGASVTIALDPGGGALQEYVEDCEVCCRPWTVRVSYQDDGSAEVWLRPLDE